VTLHENEIRVDEAVVRSLLREQRPLVRTSSAGAAAAACRHATGGVPYYWDTYPDYWDTYPAFVSECLSRLRAILEAVGQR
jgi:hypothetical protein